MCEVRIKECTNNRLRNLNGADKAVVTKARHREGKVAVSSRSVQRINIGRKAQPIGSMISREYSREKKVIVYPINKNHFEYFPYTFWVA